MADAAAFRAVLERVEEAKDVREPAPYGRRGPFVGWVHEAALRSVGRVRGVGRVWWRGARAHSSPLAVLARVVYAAVCPPWGPSAR